MQDRIKAQATPLRHCYDGAHDAVESRAAAIQLQPTAQCQPFRHMNSEFTVG